MQGVLQNGVIDVLHDQGRAVVALLEAYRFQDVEPSVDLTHTLLHCSVLEVHAAELLIARITLDVFDEGVDCFEAGFGDTRRSDLCV